MIRARQARDYRSIYNDAYSRQASEASRKVEGFMEQFQVPHMSFSLQAGLRIGVRADLREKNYGHIQNEEPGRGRRF